MIILPAIDIKDGVCVRLYQGDYAQVTTYDRDPVQVAQRWQEAGANWLHVVDLDGAAQGRPVNTDLIQRMRRETTLQIEVGGGMRSLEQIEQVLALGVERVILGTVALRDRALLEAALARWGEQIAVGLDARDGFVAVSGWYETSQVRATELAGELSRLGVRRFVYTDIARDGALSGPNLPALREMQQASESALIASGGVSSLEDLRELAQSGVEGAIVGKAIYTGAVDLVQAVRELEKGA
ncbi:1-(5-phosphoribosyl)-5-[(5-phosphoribosylamino) methylideneamino] imidazole-4-carboxamide isomerase [Ktedonobacter sp. SOSP1-52]|uniref:1-(5-phosphoribosyl)-5-[(5- phosphoribosylamino)methylideneamino]imidazole-4- carboxamide isomerase n=1 Tax=Ktedonobacter sp. SOSP1-52 TaxID=2778366 RepID=UPI001915D0C9|nr:1-(5-phosphoribosyl)-5-[(5-phosphoribosylamino)methylideneamino]imidazole-4-carboxamide isomerase [Ktedonobacter sp. SOSP1-52]GHO67819.1 1-(5-phosphoribosyl)-5-[(5-phosphoribosylamino) methylideneamino] imidazole-4-carboxamide isomerase [Ktedonobacter sp. SOSP1-52]